MEPTQEFTEVNDCVGNAGYRVKIKQI
jgi:hypothetical protein